MKCTCGCGDAFNAGFAAGLLQGKAPKDVVLFAQACSALNASGLGSQAGVVDLEGVEEFIRTRKLRAAEPELVGA